MLLGCVLAYATSQLTRWSYTGLGTYLGTDLHLDKAALGVLGAAFFYPYALAQVPWGRLTDRVGGRYVISIGVMASGGLLAGFATSDTFGEAVTWRVALGLASACAFVPIASLLARWFDRQERAMANGVYYGFGGGLGELAAFLLLPVLGVYFLARADMTAPDWRGAMMALAALVAVAGVACLVWLRSSPPLASPGEAAAPDRSLPGTGRLLRDPVLWWLGVYFAAGIIALRLIPGWLTLYAADTFRLRLGYALDEAVVAGGLIGALYVVGHVLGSPLLGWMSDRLAERGLGRVALAAWWLGVSTVLFLLLGLPTGSMIWLGLLALLMGVAIHAFPLINAAVAERWGLARAGESLGWINAVGQLAGALALGGSGYLGMAMAGTQAGSLADYLGIWYLGAVSCAVGAAGGWAAHRRIVAGAPAGGTRS